MQLSATHKHILGELARGSRLQDHRDLEGGKLYKLHSLDNAGGIAIAAASVAYLQRHKLIESNMKFPAATYLLTDKGAAIAAPLTTGQNLPLASRNYTRDS